MDPGTVEVLTPVLSGILGGAAGAAGERSLESLGGLVRRAFVLVRGDREPASEELQASADDPRGMATLLVDAAALDEGFSDELGAWLADARPLAEDPTTNSITGTVFGNVVQARDIGSVDLS